MFLMLAADARNVCSAMQALARMPFVLVGSVSLGGAFALGAFGPGRSGEPACRSREGRRVRCRGHARARSMQVERTW
jgi:hypothetical protein